MYNKKPEVIMQIKYPHKGIYTLSKYALRHLNDTNLDEYPEALKKWDMLRKEKVPERVCQQVTRISRATYFRLKKRHKQGIKLIKSKRPKNVRKPIWSEEDLNMVLKIRRENPTYGKAKIHHILKRDYGFKKSQSTVGRILSHLKTTGITGITKSISAIRPKRKRSFDKYAKRWKYWMRAEKPGQFVQIDHMSVTKNQMSFKHFQAWDPKSKYIHAEIYWTASSGSAKKFLLKLIEVVPFKIESIQVDGGSEFMRHFEEACKELGIALYVLPPRRPQHNGGVERGNRIFREEFYAIPSLVNSLTEIKEELIKALIKYNDFRPHHSLQLQTPLEYIHEHYPDGYLQSHMY